MAKYNAHYKVDLISYHSEFNQYMHCVFSNDPWDFRTLKEAKEHVAKRFTEDPKLVRAEITKRVKVTTLYAKQQNTADPES